MRYRKLGCILFSALWISLIFYKSLKTSETGSESVSTVIGQDHIHQAVSYSLGDIAKIDVDSLESRIEKHLNLEGSHHEDKDDCMKRILIAKNNAELEVLDEKSERLALIEINNIIDSIHKEFEENIINLEEEEVSREKMVSDFENLIAKDSLNNDSSSEIEN